MWGVRVRLAALIWCAVGLGLIGLKAHLDRTVLKYPDIGVRSGAETFFVPRAMIVSHAGWRADLRRLAGCWDAREAGVVQAVSFVAGCDEAQALRLTMPAAELGYEVPGKAIDAMFWSAYVPPREHAAQLVQAWRGHGDWAGRRIVERPDWDVVRLESAASPWVHLLVRAPDAGEPLDALYAGRCYRPEPLSDAGMTCSAVVRIGHKAALEFELGPDQVGAFGLVRGRLAALGQSWRR